MSREGRRTLPHMSHWGAFRVTVEGDEIVDVEGHRDDPAPSPLLANFRDGIRGEARVARPAIRRGWLERGPGPPAPGAPTTSSKWSGTKRSSWSPPN